MNTFKRNLLIKRGRIVNHLRNVFKIHASKCHSLPTMKWLMQYRPLVKHHNLIASYNTGEVCTVYDTLCINSYPYFIKRLKQWNRKMP